MNWLCESTVWGMASVFDGQILAGAVPVSSATPSIPVFRADVTFLPFNPHLSISRIGHTKRLLRIE
jgi:hypothetical protein